MANKRVSNVDSANSNRVQNCGIHNFSTDDPEKFDKHMGSADHYDVGQTTCFFCKQIFKYSIEDKVPSIRVMNRTAMHPACAKQFAKENKLV